MKNKVKVISLSLLWCVIIILFPVLSGVVCAVCKIESPKTFYIQAVSMALSLIIPLFVDKIDIPRLLYILGKFSQPE